MSPVSRFLPWVFASATVILVFANAIPATHRKVRLERERARLERGIAAEERRERALRERLRLLREDPFYLERLCLEVWRGVPRGARPWRLDAPEDHP